MGLQLSSKFSEVLLVGVTIVRVLFSTLNSQFGFIEMAIRAASTSNEELLTAIRNLETRMNDRMTSMKRDLMQEREQADERLVKRMKWRRPQR
jgi:hypothetical protein